ncbi:uncharacterized protein [Ovis canadensis]|uniref:uncharacterized protein n=1 Tax=Ovis canadensis TaxID=37174 RepID=UPI003751F727
MEASCPAWLGSGPDFEMETEARVVADHSSGLEGETHQEAAGPSQAGPVRPGTQTRPLSLFGSHADEKVRYRTVTRSSFAPGGGGHSAQLRSPQTCPAWSLLLCEAYQQGVKWQRWKSQMPPAGIRAPRHSGGSCGWWPDPLTPSKGLLLLTCHLCSRVTRRRPPDSPRLPPAATPGSWSPQTCWGPQPPAWGPVITRLTASLTSFPGAGTCLHHSNYGSLDPQLESSGAPWAFRMKPVLSQTEPRALRASPLQPPPGPCPSPSAGHQPRWAGNARPLPCLRPPPFPSSSSLSQTWTGPCWGLLLEPASPPHRTTPPPRSCGGSGLVPGCEWLGCGLQAFPGGLQASLGV